LKLLTKEQISTATSSRIYHRIGNIKKELKKERKTYRNKFGVSVEETYEYDYLTDEQMDEVIKL
jgi:hypothetical protein